MKRILLLLVLCLNISMVLGQEYKNWDKYDIEGFYTIAKSKAEAKISKNVLREGADYYIPTEMDDQVFPSGISKKITPKLYKLKDTEIYKPQNKMFHFCKTFCSKITLVNTIQNVI